MIRDLSLTEDSQYFSREEMYIWYTPLSVHFRNLFHPLSHNFRSN